MNTKCPVPLTERPRPREMLPRRTVLYFRNVRGRCVKTESKRVLKRDSTGKVAPKSASVGSNLLAGKVLPYLYCLFSKNSEKTEQVTVSDTRRLVSKNNNTTSYHRPDPSSGTMLPDVIARLYDGARPWSSIAEDQGRGGNTGAVNVR